MSDVPVSLYRILPNPWQTRTPHPGDDEHVQGLAADIKARGLLQVPLGRLMNDDGPITYMPAIFFSGDAELPDGYLAEHGWRIQLAFGHNRLAAYKLLDDREPNNGWRKMPVRIAVLDDQAMALAAWSENEQRNDLSPLEKAQALQRLAADFGWTQEQVGEHCGLNRATVANKLRLLRLPEDLQKKLHNGDLSERQALAILPAFELPAVVQDEFARLRKKSDYTMTRLDEVLAHPERKSSGDVRSNLRDALMRVTHPLVTCEKDYCRASFPVDREIAGVAAPACQGCPNQVLEGRCADVICYRQKQALFEQQELAFAAAATGLPTITNAALRERPWEAKKTFSRENRAALQRALDKHCPNLHIHYEGNEPHEWDVRVPDYPHAAYMCVRESGTICECADVDELKRQEAARQEAEQQRQAVNRVREAAIRALARDLLAGAVDAWRCVLWAFGGTRYQELSGRGKIKNIEDMGTIYERLAQETIKAAVRWDAAGIDANKIISFFATWQQEIGWDRVVIPVQTESTPPEASDA